MIAKSECCAVGRGEELHLWRVRPDVQAEEASVGASDASLRSQTAAVSMSRCAGDGVSERRSHRVCVCFRCEVCGFQCRQRASLKYHMTKHKAEADLDFACVICSKRFEKAHNLNVHMSMVHPLLQGGGVRVLDTNQWSQQPCSERDAFTEPSKL